MYKGDQIATWGYPGPPTREANQVLASYIIPDIVQQAVRGTDKKAIDDAISFGVNQMKSVFGTL